MKPNLSRALLPLATLALGVAAGWFAAGLQPAPAAAEAPADWVAQVEGEYITTAMFVDEMQRRGGRQPGQYQELSQKRALLDDLLFRRAMVKAAQDEGLDQLPEVRRALDQILANQFLQRGLRARQRAVVISDDEVRAQFEQAAVQYAVPARRRVAMLKLELPATPTEADWQAAEARATEALVEARALPPSVPHFGAVAQKYSVDADSRWRGGVIGWIADTAAAGELYSFDPAVIDAARALASAGDLSAPLRGADAVYVVRLLDVDAGRSRSFEELADGIRQGLRQQRLEQMELAFRDELLDRLRTEIREPVLAAIDPLSPPASAQPVQPPALPGDRG